MYGSYFGLYVLISSKLRSKIRILEAANKNIQAYRLSQKI